MFGTYRITREIDEKIYYYNQNENQYAVYNNKGEPLFSFSIAPFSSCSSLIINNLYANKNLISNVTLKELFFSMFQHGMIIIFQNASKPNYNTLLSLDFIDYCRLPGKYINSSPDALDSVEKDNCLSMMVLTKKSLEKSSKTSIEMLTKLKTKK
jgi:hypothetical protein